MMERIFQIYLFCLFINKVSGVFFLGSYVTHSRDFLSEERKKVHCRRRDFRIKVVFPLSVCCSAAPLSISSKAGRQGWLRADPTDWCQPRTPPCLRPTPPPTSYTSSKNRTGHQAFYWPIKLETSSDWSGLGERRLAGGEGERGAAGRELWEREAKGGLFIVEVTIDTKWLKPWKNHFFAKLKILALPIS